MRNALPAVVSAGLILLTGAVVVPLLERGPLADHMALHIASMNVAAPLLALPLMREARDAGPGRLWSTALLQMLLLWGWHAPPVQAAVVHSLPLQIAMHGSLFGTAVLFWHSLLVLPARVRWHGVAALLVSGKLACLLAALFIFAPRPLFTAHAETTLADQQLAGLLMVTACPLSYVIAAIVLTSLALGDLQVAHAKRPRRLAIEG